ncbi:MAG: glycoside hydrolase family 15 protein [Xanthomonadaceae bacterium]|nr:glycoside hydrolase family 15 protein [Xanthomonadaceae bacterium]
MKKLGMGLTAALCFLTLQGFDWYTDQTETSLDRIEQAISPEDGALGSVMASPSKQKPNYYYHWIRDAALTMREVFEWRSTAPQWSRETLLDYVAFSRQNQLTKNPSGTVADNGLGEPKFYLDGEAYWDSWGRPQNDGPALRALVLIDLAYELLKEGKSSVVRELLYDSKLPAHTVIKSDLEYISYHWKDLSFDLWEEVYANHFYTRLAQYQALKRGAKLAIKLKDSGAAQWYETQSKLVYQSLEKFYDQDRGIILVSINNKKNKRPMAEKSSGLDVAVILGVLHAGNPDGKFSVFDPRVLKTAQAIEKAFGDLYAINKTKLDREGRVMAAAIGRYPEDTYDGLATDGVGNPWFLATHALAEFYAKRGELDRADQFMRRSRYHTARYGHQSEQFDRSNGMMRGARDLTWSYASFLSVMRYMD